MSKIQADLYMENISKSFPGVLALNNVSFSANKGKVSAIVGANGAGKSTLMKVLSGAYEKYEGKIFVDGEEYTMTTPIIAKNSGIMCVYQEVDTSLIPNLTVAENIYMDDMAMSQKGTIINWKKMYQKCKSLLDDIGIQLSPQKMISELTLSEKQMVLIARAMVMDIKFLILDEPTAPLSVNEIEILFSLIRRLKERNIGIIYISHRLNEVLEITDTVTVMRNGQVTANLITKNTTRSEIIEQMVGASFANEYPKFDVTLGDELFRAENMRYKDKVRGVSFSLREGEILGIAGLVGAGKTELSKILFGAEKADSGEVFVRGKSVKVSAPTKAIANGIALVPEERRSEGIMVEEDITHNLTIACLDRFCKVSFIDSKKEIKEAGDMVEEVKVVTPSLQQLVKNLSGGNQQKVSIGKWLMDEAEVYMMDEPTKGIDVGSKAEIFKLAGKLATQGKGVIYLTNEMDEIIGICDRVLVMYDGQIVKELLRSEMTAEKLLYYSTGGKDQ